MNRTIPRGVLPAVPARHHATAYDALVASVPRGPATLARVAAGIAHLVSSLLIIVAMAASAGAQPVDPRAPGAITLLELGRLTGSLKQVTAVDERFGRQIYAIGDVNSDGLDDWILTHRRCDTSFNGHASVELLLYHGVRGGLPPSSAGIRIGPTEIGADCSFIGAGDYDGDAHRDIVVSQRILGDPYAADYSFSSVVVYWNDGTGHFSTTDTTHLTEPNQRICIAFPDNERWARAPEPCDIDRDGTDDLVVVTFGAERVDTVRYPYPWILIHRGIKGSRWGRDGTPTPPDWQLWQRSFTRRVSALDHDGDGVLDIAMHIDDRAIGRRGSVAVIYGSRGALPDTSSIEHIDYIRRDGFDGKQSEFIDLTGDRVPELVLSAADTIDGLKRHWLVYVGRRGQRLRDQYGSGDDPPRPGDSLWWGRPWTIVQTAYSLNPAWMPPFDVVIDPGDIGLDGVGDFCATSFPSIVCYNGGGHLDERIDALLPTWPADPSFGPMLVQLGDVDGSGRPTVAVPFDGGGVRFYRADPRIPKGGTPIRLPTGTDRPSSTLPDVPGGAAKLSRPPTVWPNPAADRASVSWTATGSGVVVSLVDALGRELRRWVLPPGIATLAIDLIGVPAGVYLVTVASGGRSRSAALVHDR